ncbi:hypothetical protein EVAR_89911_1 [Eumeta japonica]|uniref:Uncharacterized protein n=1 Tax=Eumeta variegata TaxID=151549 RepID=A0A4C2A7Y9_EUMVA|nr:hypothetical protein EVAR_89911_1 [Eumeta japonica]
MATFQLHHQTLLPYSIKVLVKTNQTSPNSMGLRRLITEFLWPPSSSIIRRWLPYSIKVLVKRNQTSPNSMAPSSDPCLPFYRWLLSSEHLGSIIRRFTISVLVKSNEPKPMLVITEFRPHSAPSSDAI